MYTVETSGVVQGKHTLITFTPLAEKKILTEKGLT